MDKIKRHLVAHVKFYFGILILLMFYLGALLYKELGLLSDGWLSEIDNWWFLVIWAITRGLYFFGLLWLTLVIALNLEREIGFTYRGGHRESINLYDLTEDVGETFLILVFTFILGLVFSELILSVLTTWPNLQFFPF